MKTQLVWKYGGRHVLLAGSFTNWQALPMQHNNEVWTESLQLNSGSFQYKFIVDGDWKYDPQGTLIDDGSGNVNNLLVIGSQPPRVQQPPQQQKPEHKKENVKPEQKAKPAEIVVQSEKKDVKPEQTKNQPPKEGKKEQIKEGPPSKEKKDKKTRPTKEGSNSNRRKKKRK